MRNFTQVFFLCAIAMSGYGQLTFNMELVSSIDNGESGNDIWGYVDSTGVEYAIMGTRATTKIWSLEDPSNPIERASIPGPVGTWRDIKSFEDHIYVTSDQGTDGLLIIDMSGAPPCSKPTGCFVRWSTGIVAFIKSSPSSIISIPR